MQVFPDKVQYPPENAWEESWIDGTSHCLLVAIGEFIAMYSLTNVFVWWCKLGRHWWNFTELLLWARLRCDVTTVCNCGHFDDMLA